MDWKDFFQNYRDIDINNDTDLLYQVGKSVGGKPITNDQFFAITNTIIHELQLSENDTLLDLCCGNGLITFELSKKVKEVIAIDVSKAYIDTANKYKKNENIYYLNCDVRNYELIINSVAGKKINKVLIYESLAYLTPLDLEMIMAYLDVLSAPGLRFMIGSILDKEKKINFFNTISRKLDYLFRYKLLGRDMGLGRWWTKKEIRNTAEKYGYACRIVDQNAILHTAHYRFDVVLTKN